MSDAFAQRMDAFWKSDEWTDRNARRIASSSWDKNHWRDHTTANLLRELECLRWELAEIDEDPALKAAFTMDRAIVVLWIREINGELARRRRLRTNRHAPSWPSPERDRKAELAEIKRRVPLIDLINREVFRVYERRKAHDVWCCCPLPGHEEQTPSFHIDEQQQIFHCFGCGRGGDVFELARHLWSVGEFHVVADRLREVAGIEPPKPTAPDVRELRRGPAPMRRSRR